MEAQISKQTDLFPETPIGEETATEVQGNRPRNATDTLEFDKTIRIAVTGDVFLTEEERMIVDTPQFQRLRGVRQLGTVGLVYPTALHTRFDHSLGTLSMADRMVMAIAQNASSKPDQRNISMVQRRLARLYALLHDITHIPYGHTIEDEVPLFARHDQNLYRLNYFLGPKSNIGKIIQKVYQNYDKNFYNRFMAIALWTHTQHINGETDESSESLLLQSYRRLTEDDLFIHDIVSNTVCADLLDYLRRDSYFCNLQIHLEYRFLNHLYLQAPNMSESDPLHGKRRVFVRLWKRAKQMPRRDILTDLTRLLDARYMLAERAYFHHAKLITSAMIARAIEDSGLYLQSRSGHRESPALYQESDDTFLASIVDAEQRVAKARPDNYCLGKMLRDRSLFKQVARFDGDMFEGLQKQNHEVRFKEHVLNTLRDPFTRNRIENTMAVEIGHQPGSVLLYAPPSTMNMKVAKVNVHWEGHDTTLSQIVDPIVAPRLKAILKAHQLLWGIWIFAVTEVAEDEHLKELLVSSFKTRFLEGAGNQDALHRHWEDCLTFHLERRARTTVSKLPYQVVKNAIQSEVKQLLATKKHTRKDGIEDSEALQKLIQDMPSKLNQLEIPSESV